MDTYFLRFRTTPLPASAHYAQFGGAHWHLWIVATDQESAERRAYEYIREQGWQVEEFKDVYLVHRQDMASEPGLLAQFDQAQEAGIATELFTFRDQGPQFN